MGHKGHWGEYTGNAKWSRDHAHTRVTSKNYDDAVKDDAAHIDYLKRDINYDAKHGHSDEKMTADEKHISKLAGDMKYDKKHHGMSMSALHAHNDEKIKELQKKITEAKERGKKYGGDDVGSPDYDVKQDVEQDVKAYTAQIKKLSEAHNKDKDKESDAAPQMHCMGKK